MERISSSFIGPVHRTRIKGTGQKAWGFGVLNTKNTIYLGSYGSYGAAKEARDKFLSGNIPIRSLKVFKAISDAINQAYKDGEASYLGEVNVTEGITGNGSPGS
jgi:hypothetical protein